MDYGIKHNLIKNGTRKDLLGNRLVLIVPKDSKIGSVTIAPGFDLAALAGSGRIATGDVRAVPAGLYAKAALEKLGIWSSVELKNSDGRKRARGAGPGRSRRGAARHRL